MMKFIGAIIVALFAAVPALAQIPPVVGTASTLLVKSGPGTLLDGYVTINSAGYLYVFNTTTIPVNGSVTAGLASGDYQDCISVPNAGSYPFSSFGLPGEKFSVGIYLAWSSDACGTLALASPQFMKARSQ